ncbi:MAG: hypothetical protein VX196_06250 [Pseudomonadota bacterium]|nr:hypothetical protein [Pseudomonadota bacterium]
MRNTEQEQQQTATDNKITSWFKSLWSKNKVAITGAAGALVLIGGITAAGLWNSDKADTDKVDNQDNVIEQVETAPEADTENYDAESNTIVIPGDNADDVIEEPVEEPPVLDTIVDSPEEVLTLLESLGLTDVFADEVKRIQSDNVKVASQATKDIGHNLANGIKTTENDALANQFFQASYDMDSNVQAAHSIGYQSLHGLGMDTADLDLAEKMLSEANDNGHPLAKAHLDYLYTIK